MKRLFQTTFALAATVILGATLGLAGCATKSKPASPIDAYNHEKAERMIQRVEHRNAVRDISSAESED